MIRWLKKLLSKSETPRETALRKLMDPIPDKLITQLAADIVAAEQDKIIHKGFSLSESELVKLRREIEFRLHNPGKHKGEIPVRVESLYMDLLDRNLQKYPSSSSSPISDVRVKANVRPLCNALETTLALRGVQFNWKQEDYPGLNLNLYPEIGLIAQEVEAVLPTVVRENDKGFKTVNYACLVPVLIEAIREQQISIKELKNRLQLLEAGAL